MSSEALIFDDISAVKDLASFVSRAKIIEDDAAQFVARGTALAVYVPVLAKGSVDGGDFTVLGMRVHRLAEPRQLNACYSLAAIQDRLARMGETSTTFTLPPVEENPAWAGIQVPVAGWEPVGQISDAHLAEAARSGINAVTEALPENPGAPVITQVRQRIWSSPLPETNLPGGIQLPLGAGFAMHSLGFITEAGTSAVYRSGSWLRVSGPRGHVLVRRSNSLL